MSGVWIFKNGVARLVANPTNREAIDGAEAEASETRKRKVLVHLPSNQTITCYADLEQKLVGLGWERYPGNEDPQLLQFHKPSSPLHLISLPSNFAKFNSIHMYDIVVKNRSFFQVRDHN